MENHKEESSENVHITYSLLGEDEFFVVNEPAINEQGAGQNIEDTIPEYLFLMKSSGAKGEVYDKEILNRMLAALKLSKNIVTYQWIKENLPENLSAKKIIIFGFEPDDQSSINEIIDKEGCKFLYADTLQNIDSDKAKKMAFWTKMLELVK